jgi:hypothetical protein
MNSKRFQPRKYFENVTVATVAERGSGLCRQVLILGADKTRIFYQEDLVSA